MLRAPEREHLERRLAPRVHTMIDRHYGHLVKDGRQHAINLLDTHSGAGTGADVHAVDARWTRKKGSATRRARKTSP